MTTTTKTDRDRGLDQIADTLQSIGEGNTADGTDEKTLGAINAALRKVEKPELHKLLERARNHLRCHEMICVLEAEIAEKNTQLASLQKQLLTPQQLKYLSFDIHELISR